MHLIVDPMQNLQESKFASPKCKDVVILDKKKAMVDMTIAFIVAD